jgi:UDP-N-acetylmuramoyl-tripeptide--D-alanyl-D-alanine ligase
MKSQLLKALELSLKRLSQLTIWRYRPGVVGVTGNVGKTSTKLAISAVLGSGRKVRWSQGNFNSEFGLPLTILGNWGPDELFIVSRKQPAGERSFAKAIFWLKVLGKSLYRLAAYRPSDYPEILVLEYGADKPGDIKHLVSLARPNVSVITAIGEIPVHVEFYNGPEDVAREKARLIECLPSSGYAILNRDDERVMGLKDRTRAHLMTFGFSKDADMKIVNFENRIENDHPVGIAFKLQYGGHSVPVKVDNAFGKSQAYAAAAAACVGVVFGLNLVKISEALKSYVPADSRMQLMPGIKGTYIINDAYNASMLSMTSALETLQSLPGKRKVAVLGDMLELGKYTLEAHERIGTLAGSTVDTLVTVGPRAKFIAEAAIKAGLSRRNVTSFDTAEEAQQPVQALIKKGDLILIKASRGIHLEKVVEEIKAF